MIFAGSSFIASMLLTYAVHSAAACLVALALAQLLRRPHDRDIIWKAAIVVPIFTAASAFGIVRLANGMTPVDISNLVRQHAGRTLPGRRLVVEMSGNAGSANVVRHLTDPVAGAVSDAVLAVGIAVVALALLRLVVRRRRLRRLISNRAGQRTIGRTTHGRPIVVSTCGELQSPIALGRAEICLPTEVAASFDDAHRRALLAHEAAHLDRRDPAWIVAVDTIAALSAFQPLVFAIARAFRRDAELVCDESALRDTGDRSALIAALALLAAPFDPRGTHAGVASAVDGSPLVARAERIATVSLEGKTGRRSAALAAAIVILFAALLAVPVIAPAAMPRDARLGNLLASWKGRGSVRVNAVDSTLVDARVRRVRQERIVEVR